ncbi:hypothetical protein RvY_11020 [Ramazzottius varieornatus]|uniref:Reverse transcriptase domain-containing protein n=1 Tax=Ramazzottius varieornatus TaxID=947166 RepID=A0A1D1VNN0_RAMVA|nr:hypothetical protein RvY_11020 [Ramazzottius varieornatus]
MSTELLEALASVTTDMLNGKVPSGICPFLYGASLTALVKKDGGIRPIAVGCTLRRLAGKVFSKRVMAEMGAQLRPEQAGYGTEGGAEAAVHAARLFLSRNSAECQVLLKLDFKNAFNTVFCGRMLAEVEKAVPQYFHFASQMYSQLSNLIYRDQVLQSARGVQQGDPLGPLFFYLVTKDLSKSVKSAFNCWYLDDATIRGDVDRVTEDFQRVADQCAHLGLELNMDKCEIFVFGGSKKEQLSTKSAAKITNTSMTDPVWIQASLPVAKGGLGLRRAEEIALSTYLASISSAKQLVTSMVADFDLDELCATELTSWMEVSSTELPLAALRVFQHTWDLPIVEKNFSEVLQASSLTEKAKNVGGIDEGVRSVAERPLKGSLRRALVTCKSHAILEPNGVLKDDTRKRPDGMTLVPWKEGEALVWDVTCVDTLCDSHVGGSAENAGDAANKAEDLKRTKYRNLEEKSGTELQTTREKEDRQISSDSVLV